MKVRSHMLTPFVSRGIAILCATVFVISAHTAQAENAVSLAEPAAPVFEVPFPGRLVYFSGPIMQTYKAYTIFWDPTHSIPSSYQSLINRWFTDLGGSALLDITTEYYQDDSQNPFAQVQNAAALGGTWVDNTNPYPHAGTPGDPLLGEDIRSEIQRAMDANPGWPTGGLGAEFLVYTSRGVEVCDRAGCTPGVPGTGSRFCAAHNWFPQQPGSTTPVIYAVMPYAATWTCNPGAGPHCLNDAVAANGLPAAHDCLQNYVAHWWAQQHSMAASDFRSPNSGLCQNNDPGCADADVEINCTSHEQIESITDPLLEEWLDGAGLEMSDKCDRGVFGSIAEDGRNVTLNGHPYLVQEEWSDAANGCRLSMFCAATPRADCRKPVQSGASVFQLKIGANPNKNALSWKWNKGAATSLADFGDPTATNSPTTYGLCVYAEGDGSPFLAIEIAGPPVSGWVRTAAGFKYTNKKPTDNQPRQISLTTGGDGKAKISVNGKGASLPMPALPLKQNPKVIVQLQNSAGVCWEADYSNATKTNSSGFKARSD